MKNIITLSTHIDNDDYTSYVYDNFDIQNKESSVTEIPYNLSEINEFDWNIGLIVGSSGSGKSTILKSMGDIREPVFPKGKALISCFNWLTPKEASMLLTSMGLSSVPSWLRPYDLLSNGEQYRAKLAYLISSSNPDEVILIDEYTSVVDRNVAKAMSVSLQKYIRRNGKRVVLASCHYDILEWLMPDWTYSPISGVLDKHDYLRQGRPKIHLSVSRVEHGAWNIFKKHHYLTESNNKAYAHYLFCWKEQPVGIVIVSPLPSGTIKNAYRGSRTVVLPDYQGLGIGSKISEFIAGVYRNNGAHYYTKTVNPALGEYRNKSEKWVATPDNGKERKPRNAKSNYDHWVSKKRVSYCHRYNGEPISGYDELIIPIEKMRSKNQLFLFT